MTGFVTEGDGSDQVLVPSSHEGIDHTAGPLSLLDAAAHDAIDHAALTTPLMSVAAHNTLDHGAIPATNVGEDNPVQVSPAERTAGTEGAERSFSPFDVATMVTVHSTVSIVLSFGANLIVAATDFARVNGQADDGATLGTTPTGQTVSPKAGTSITLAWNVATSGGFVRTYLNGATAGVAVSLGAAQGTNTQAITVAAGDRLAIQFESGTVPGNANFQLMIS